MKLIIAEKPNLGRTIVGAIPERMVQKRGYYEGDSYLVSYGFGHLFGLQDIEAYFQREKSSWTMEYLPFVPTEFQFQLKKDPKTKKVDDGVQEQFDILKTLMNREDVDSIIHCGDADREGEVIVRLIIQKGLHSYKPVLRLWLPDQTPETILHALQNLQKDDLYDQLFYEGLTRTYIDWIYGINLTRYLTIKSKADFPLRVGRVLSAILWAIYEREMQIVKFKPQTYFKIESETEVNGEKITLQCNTEYQADKKNKAEEKCHLLNEKQAQVTKIERTKQVQNPGKLYSLSKLQGVLGLRFKMSMQDSLRIIQSLYERGYVTYPRTNTEYLAENEKGKVQEILEHLAESGYQVAFRESKNIFDDTKIESHSALTPTTKMPSSLSEEEQKVYNTILQRFLAVFCSVPCEYEKSRIHICVGEEIFELKGHVLVNKGYLMYEDFGKKDALLPKIQEGDRFSVCFKTKEKQTSPPKKYNLETLNNFLKNPFRIEKVGDDTAFYKAMLEGVEIGTEATRTGIINNAIVVGYIKLENNTYSLLPLGAYAVEAMEELGIDMTKERTVELSKLLKKVYRSEIKMEDAIAQAKKELNEFFAQREKGIQELPDNLKRSVSIGSCPICGKNVVQRKGPKGMFYSCSGYIKKELDVNEQGCTFSLPGIMLEASITPKMATELLTKRKTKVEKMISKSGKEFSAFLVLEITGNEANLNFVFPKNKYKKHKKKEEV